MPYYAHTTESPDKSTWEPLEVHLREVSETASTYAAPFGSAEWVSYPVIAPSPAGAKNAHVS